MLPTCTEQQRQAAEHGQVLAGGGVISTPQLIIAGAGTGKTNTLAHRAAFLILNGVEPSRILLMTFSRRAATELSNRALRIVFNKLQRADRDNPKGIDHKAAESAAESSEADGPSTFTPAISPPPFSPKYPLSQPHLHLQLLSNPRRPCRHA